MTYTGMRTANGMIILDGYSKAKTVKGAIKDLAREVAKYNQTEAAAITQCIDETIATLNREATVDEYAIQCEEAPCASRIVFLNGDEDDYSEENTEMEYADANFYLCIRFVE